MNSKSYNTTFLDSFRGLAAIYVMIGHSRWLLWEGYSEGYILHPHLYSKFEKFQVYFFSFFRYGHEAVLLFFVLSGFVIHLKYSKRLSIGIKEFDFINFFQRRAKRIIPPLLIAILITYILDKIGSFLGYTIYSGCTQYSLINESIGNDHSGITLLGNILFLMDFYIPVFGSNGPLWSLAYEWYFYTFYPLLFVIARYNRVASFFTVLVLFILTQTVGFSVILLQKIFSLCITWWFGTLLADIYTGTSRVRFLHLAPLSVLLLFMPINNLFTGTLVEVMWALGFAGLFSLFFVLQEYFPKLMNGFNRLKVLGDFSYSLYVFHMPMLVFISGYLLKKENGVLPIHFNYVYLGIVLSMTISYCLYFISERPFIRKRGAKSIKF